MNILLVTPKIFPESGGAAQYFNQISKLLSTKDQVKKIIILTTWDKKFPLFYSHEKTTVLRLLVGSRLNILNMIECLFFTFLISSVYKIDVIHMHGSLWLEGVCVANRVLHKYLIIDIRDRLGGYALSKYASIIGYCSLNIAEYLHDFNNKVYLPVPIDIKSIKRNALIYNNKYLINKNSILYVGDITYNKGILELILAFKQFKQKYPEYKLYIIGKNYIDKNLHKLSKYGINYLGELSHSDVISIMVKTKIVIMPSKIEALPRVCLEGMILDKKVIFPPDVPEFKSFCPFFTLTSTKIEDILDKLIMVLSEEKKCCYPLRRHDLKHYSNILFSIYDKIYNIL